MVIKVIFFLIGMVLLRFLRIISEIIEKSIGRVTSFFFCRGIRLKMNVCMRFNDSFYKFFFFC